MSSLKEKIAEAISKYVVLEDTYTYELTRVKSEFEAGTMSLDDFEEWSEENVDGLAKAIVDALQPQLSKKQQASINKAKKFYRKGVDLYDCSIDMLIYDGLQDKEWAEATVTFLKWALEQEKE